MRKIFIGVAFTTFTLFVFILCRHGETSIDPAR